MKKLSCLLIALFLASIIYSQTVENPSKVTKKNPLIAFSIGAGARYVLDDAFADVYDQFNLSLNADLALKIGKSFEIFFHSDFMSLKGALTYTGGETKLSLIPIELGLRFIMGKKKLHPYLGLGGGFYMFKEESEIGEFDENVFGFFAETGLRYDLSKRFFFDLKVKYVNFEVKPEAPDVGEGEYIYVENRNLSGLALQGSIGIQF